MITKMYRITGMHCDGCVANVKNAIKSVPGVIEAQVHLKEPNAIVSMEKEIPAETFEQVVSNAGHYQLAELADEAENKKNNPADTDKPGILSGLFGKKDCCK